MKRIFVIGIIGAVLMMMMGAVVVLGLLVTPVRAQIGQVINQALQGAPLLAAQTLQNSPQQTVKGEKGVLIAGVFQDSPADKAGLARGDIILSVDGQAVNTVQDLETVLTKHKSGDTLQLSVQHGDTQKTVSATLADVPAAATPEASPTVAPNSTPQSGQQGNNNNNGKPFTYRMFNQTGPYLGIIPIGAGQDMGHTESFEATSPQQGEVIRQVASGSPAEKAGLKVGEAILSVDGQQLDQQNTLQVLIAKHKAGDSVKLQIMGTDGTMREVSVTLASNPQDQNSAYLGVSVGRSFRFHKGFGPGMVQTPGALIMNVTQGSPAEKAGLKTGDVIQSVDGQKIGSAEALSSAVSGHKPGDSVTLTVFDNQSGSSKDVKVTLGDNPQKAGSAWLGISYNFMDVQPVQPGQPGQPQLPGNNNNNNGGSQGTQF